MAGKESPRRILVTAFVLSIACSLFVSIAAVALAEAQDVNKLFDKQRNIATVSGLSEGVAMTVESLREIFTQIVPRAVDLDSGEILSDFDFENYDERSASRDPELSMKLSRSQDIASIKRREHVSLIYEVLGDAGDIQAVILPIRGYGLWSTLHGFLALEGDGKTILGITFFEHGETAGLGGEVDNPKWKSLWKGKSAYDDQGNIAISVIKGAAAPGANAIDGISGATLTARGVDNMIKFWLGELGFAKYIEKNFRS